MKPALRVYLTTHTDGHLTGHLIPRWSGFLTPAPPTAYGRSEDAVLSRLGTLVRNLDDAGDTLDRYLWQEHFEIRSVRVEVHPLTAVDKRLVVSRQTLPLTMSYAWSKLGNAGFRVLLPRFGWSWVLEDLDMAPEILRQEVSAALTGRDARWVFEFRRQGEEQVREWAPRWLDPTPAGPSFWDYDEFETLHQVAEELVELAARRRLPAVVGELDFRPFERLFEHHPPASLLLVGAPGVGKSTWVRRLAEHFARWRSDPERDAVPRIWSTSADRIKAGMIYLGMWEKRCLDLVEELAYEEDYLYVDRLPALLAEQTSRTSIGDLLMPAVANEEISLIAECTEAELELCQRRAPGWVNLFHIVRLEEPSQQQMPGLLNTYLRRRRGRAAVSIHPQGLRRLTQLLASFQPGAAFPGKGFRFIDRLIDGATGTTGATRRRLDPSDVVATFSRQTGLPVELISDEHAAGGEVIASRLAERVIGQDVATRACAGILARFKAGLDDPSKPCGCLLFVGPTGVGKTELAKQLARYLFGDADRLLRYDMSEFHLPGSAQRLLAAGPGAESLATRLRREPLSLILFDEIEKAHWEVFDLLLGLLGEGRLTDESGRLVDGRMALIVLTSNLGAATGAPPGFGDTNQPELGFRQAVRKHFRPELINRLDEIVAFRNLSLEDVQRIVDLMIERVARRPGFERRGIRLDVSAAARDRLARLGWHPSRGARPLGRVIEERVVTPAAVRLSEDPALENVTLRVDSGEESVEEKNVIHV